MTTQTPYEPPQPGTYPTSPPWAAPPPEQPQQQQPSAPWGDMQYTNQHGQLMVPYPEEMINAGRSKPPPWYPVMLFTLFFGPLGAISAVRRAGRARKGRNDRHPYWIAFGSTMVVYLGLLSVAVAIAIPVYVAVRDRALTEVVQEHAAATAGVASASCRPTGARQADGLRGYRCEVRLDNGRTGSIRVKSDKKGTLQPAK